MTEREPTTVFHSFTYQGDDFEHRGTLAIAYPERQGPRGFCYDAKVSQDHEFNGHVSGDVRIDGDGHIEGLDALLPEPYRDSLRLEILEVMNEYAFLVYPEGTSAVRELRTRLGRG